MKRNRYLLFFTVLISCVFAGCVPSVGEIIPGNPIIVEESIPENTPAPIPSQTPEEVLPTPTLQQTEVVYFEELGGKIPVIYSHGGGPCDIGGMVFFTKHPNVDLIGYVLTRGEYYPEIAVKKWPVFLFDVLDYKSTSIALGSNERMDPNSHDFPESWRPLSGDFWGLALPDQVTDFEVGVGSDLIVDLVNNSPEKVTIIAMASMIDVALALQQDPGIIDNISHVVIMGGAFTVPGNLSDAPYPISNEAAEWNMWIDARAAQYIFNSGVSVSIIPLDAIQYYVQQADLTEINAIDDPGVKYVAQMWNKQWGWRGGGFFIWDTITVTAVTNPENFHWEYDGIDVITETGDFQGQTIALNNGAQHIRYATGADYDAVLDRLFETFRGETVLEPPADTDSSDLSSGDPTAEPDIIISELAGIWEGFTGDFNVTFFLETDCSLNEKCGTFEILEFSLTGDVTFVDSNENIFEFEITNLSSGEPSADYEYLELLDDGTLKYFSSDQFGSSEAVLVRR